MRSAYSYELYSVGMDANLTIMNKKLEVQGTLVQGNWAYKILSDD